MLHKYTHYSQSLHNSLSLSSSLPSTRQSGKGYSVTPAPCFHSWLKSSLSLSRHLCHRYSGWCFHWLGRQWCPLGSWRPGGYARCRQAGLHRKTVLHWVIQEERDQQVTECRHWWRVGTIRYLQLLYTGAEAIWSVVCTQNDRQNRIKYDMMILMCAWKWTSSQLSVLHNIMN